MAEPVALRPKHVLCPFCRTINRLPIERPAISGKCGKCHEKLFQGEPIGADEAAFGEHLRENDIPLLIDMWAPWCGPCRTMAPMFEAACRILEPEVRLLKVNVDEAPDAAARFGVRSIPTLLLVQNERRLGQAAGVKRTDDIVRWVRAQLPSGSRS